jgi:hypothetical protein
MKSSQPRAWLAAALFSLVHGACGLSADAVPAATHSAAVLTAVPASAAAVPEKPLAQKGASLFSDDFERAELGKAWLANTPSFTIANGIMVGSQTRPEHGAVASAPVAFKDAIIEFKFRFEGATSINAVCDDKAFTGSHAGHICRVTITPRQIRLGDDKEGGMRNDILEMRRDPARKAEGDKLLVGRGQAINTTIEPHRWYRMTIEIVDDEMRVSLDDQPLGYLKSSGIAHPTKSHFHFTVTGKDAQLDDVRIWSAVR